MQTTLAKHTVNEKGIDGFRDQEFQQKMRSTKIIELTAELEAKSALLEALTREKQKVDRERDREVMCSDFNGSVDKHEASDKFIRCAKEAPQISFARHHREVMCSDFNGSVDKHKASDKFIRCAKEAPQISFADHQSVITNKSGSAHDEPEGGKTDTKVGFFKSLAQSIRTKREEASKREEARQRQQILGLLHRVTRYYIHFVC